MWKRLQQKQVGRQQTTGDTSLDDSVVAGMPYGGPQQILTNINISSAIPTATSARPMRPPRSPRQPPTSIPSQPLQRAPARQQSSQANTRPASSIYSHPSPTFPTITLPRNNSVARAYGEQVEISPPSSPETRPVDRRQREFNSGHIANRDISPVDEMPDVSQLPQNQPTSRPGSRAAGATNIPVLRREKRRNQIAAVASNFVSKKEDYGDGVKSKRNSDTRWDTLTGEPTMSERGRPPQVKPSEFTPPGNSIYDTAIDRGLGLATTGSGIPKIQSSFVERVKNLTQNNMMTGARPEWKGSSGRESIVPPVADQPNIAPLNIPRKSSKRATSPRHAESGTHTPLSAILSSHTETSLTSPTTSGTITPILQSVPGRRSPPRYIESPTPLAHHPSVTASQAFASPISENIPQHFLENVVSTPDDNTATQHKKQDSISSVERHFREALKDVNFPEQPVSRFSVTTYATTTASSSPRVSTESLPPMPTPPQEFTPAFNRHRPKVITSFDSTKATARKAVPNSPVFISLSAASASRRNSKMLPKSPPEAQSKDLISSLEAQLNNLAHRRANLEKSIHQMTALMPVDVLARGMEAKRQADEKKKVEILKEDLADVVREEHDIGLRLHRAHKRRDNNAIYEPTGLWVRRVTG